MNDFAARIHLKTDVQKKEHGRNELIQYCLANPERQYLVIGWSCVHLNHEPITTFDEFYNAYSIWCKKRNKRIDSSSNLFKDAQIDDLLWTRDLSGYYWICRVKEKAEAHYDDELDIGAQLPVEAYRYGLEVPGQIKAAFNRPNGGVVQRIRAAGILEFSKFAFNECAARKQYEIHPDAEGNFILNLPEFELEELVISYLQIEYNYYVLSNSIANRSTTILIECELMSRDQQNPMKAVVQVKSAKGEIDVSEYRSYLDNDYRVYFFAGSYKNKQDHQHIVYISEGELLRFYRDYKTILPKSITRWENLFATST